MDIKVKKTLHSLIVIYYMGVQSCNCNKYETPCSCSLENIGNTIGIFTIIFIDFPHYFKFSYMQTLSLLQTM